MEQNRRLRRFLLIGWVTVMLLMGTTVGPMNVGASDADTDEDVTSDRLGCASAEQTPGQG